MGDETRECVTCKRKYIWSYGEQRFYRERRLSPPKHCPTCRTTRRIRGTYPHAQGHPGAEGAWRDHFEGTRHPEQPGAQTHEPQRLRDEERAPLPRPRRSPGVGLWWVLGGMVIAVIVIALLLQAIQAI